MKALHLLCVPMVALGLAACERDPAILAEQDYRIEHPLTAEKQTAVAVFDGPILTEFDHDRLKRLAAESIRRGAGTVQVVVQIAAGGEAEAAAAGDQVAELLRHEGVKAIDVGLRVETANAAGGGAPMEIRVQAPVWVAVVPGCGTFERGMNPDYTNAPNSNWGCSIQRNTALMLQNPADLIRARESTGRDANRAADVLGKYGRGEATSSAPEAQTTGTTSTVATGK